MDFRTIGGFCLSLLAAGAAAQTAVLTQRNDNFRSGINRNEAVLNQGNVQSKTFGKIFARLVDGQIYTQPLIAPGIDVSSVGRRNLVLVATANNSVYAFDADAENRPEPYWKVSFNDASKGITPVPYKEVAAYADMHPIIGVVSTPVIQLTSDGHGGTVFVVAKTKEVIAGKATYAFRIHALNLANGLERSGSPVAIEASVPGIGNGSLGGQMKFQPMKQMQRPALLLSNGIIYIAFGSHTDLGSYHGWILGYRADDLSQKYVYCNTPNGQQAGIWQSGQGLSTDSVGNIFATSGNGTTDLADKQFGSSLIRLRPTPSELVVEDYFTPRNFEALNANDMDFGSTGAVYVPESGHLLFGSKMGRVYATQADNLGKYSANDQGVVQWWDGALGHYHGSPLYWNGRVFAWSEYDRLKQFRYQSSQVLPYSLVPVAQGAVVAPSGMPGGFLSLSSFQDATKSGVLWANMPYTGNANFYTVPGILRAYDPISLRELWNSKQVPERDDFGYFAKFICPTVANGRVYLPSFGADDGSTQHALNVYGLLRPGTPEAPIDLVATARSRSVTLSWSPTAGAVTYSVKRAASGSGNFATVASDLRTTSYDDGAVSDGATYFYRVVAQSAGVSSGDSATASASVVQFRPLLRINSGGADGDGFVKDQMYVGGNSVTASKVIEGSTSKSSVPLSIFQNERSARNFKYRLLGVVPGAAYTLRLYFSETKYTLANKRVFSVSVNGQTAIPNFDIFAIAGFAQGCSVDLPAIGQADGSITVSFDGNATSYDKTAKVDAIDLLGDQDLRPLPPTVTVTSSYMNTAVAWKEPPGALGYTIYRGLTPETLQPHLTGINSTPIRDTWIAPNSNYFYAVTVTGPTGESALSTPVSGIASDFSLSSSSNFVSVRAGESVSFSVWVNASPLVKEKIAVGYWLDLPTGMAFDRRAVYIAPGLAGTFKLNTTTSAPKGIYAIPFRGTSYRNERTVLVQIEVK